MSPKKVSSLFSRQCTFRITFLFFSLVTFALPSAGADDSKWTQWADHQAIGSDDPVVQNRQVSKAQRFQIIGPMGGIQERADLYNTYSLAFGGRYHFTEEHGWEFLRGTFSFSSATEMVQEIQEKTSYVPDSKLSKFQLSSSYIYTPIYGKYAWNSKNLVYFDIYGLLGTGLRFSDQLQPFAEIGVGMNHCAFSRWLAITPELRWRFYSEKRSSNVFVSESLIQLGVSWLP